MADAAAESSEKLLKAVSASPKQIIDLSSVRFADEKGDSVRDQPGDASAKEARMVLGERSDVDPVEGRIKLKLYPRRWIVLASVALLNNSNTMLWIAFAAIANHANAFYGYRTAANLFSMIYIICTIPVGIFAMYMGSRFGLRNALLIAAWTNAVGAVLRFSSSFVPLALRFPIGISGQAIAACSYPFIMFLPTTVAGTWFADNERTLATTIGVMANPLGVLLANLISPQVVSDPSDIPRLNGIVMVLPLIACVLVTFGVNRSQPKYPPTIGGAKAQMQFVPALKSCLASHSYLVLLVVLGGGIGMFNCLYTVMQQMLCPSGYSNTFSGLCAAIMIIGGICGATAAGLFVDRTKLYEETMKVAFAFAVVSGIVFLQLTLRPSLAMWIGGASFLFGVFGLAAYPVGLEISAECTFPAPETISTGLVVISGQIQSVIYVALMGAAGRDLQPQFMSVQTCSKGDGDNFSVPKDNTLPVIIFSAIAGALALLLIIFFRPKLKRLTAEQGIRKNGPSKGEGGRLLKDAEVRLNTLDRTKEPESDNIEVENFFTFKT